MPARVGKWWFRPTAPRPQPIPSEVRGLWATSCVFTLADLLMVCLSYVNGRFRSKRKNKKHPCLGPGLISIPSSLSVGDPNSGPHLLTSPFSVPYALRFAPPPPWNGSHHSEQRSPGWSPKNFWSLTFLLLCKFCYPWLFWNALFSWVPRDPHPPLESHCTSFLSLSICLPPSLHPFLHPSLPSSFPPFLPLSLSVPFFLLSTA